MAGPQALADPSVADRIKRLRRMRGLSVRTAADLAGISHSTWSRIEAGTIGTDNRFTLAKIASALGWSVADLAQTLPPNDPDSVAGWLTVQPTRRALVETDLTEDATAAVRTVAELAPEVDLVQDLRLRCDYAGQGQRMGQLLRDLHAAAQGPERDAALRLLVMAAVEAESMLRNLEFPGDAFLAAERAQQAAVQLDDPVMLGLAAWVRGHSASSCGAYGRAVTVVERAIPVVERGIDLPGGRELLGALHLLAAFALSAQGRRDEADDQLAEATRLAALTGDSPALGLCFGPTNLRFWQVALAVEVDEAARAVEIARGTNPDAVPANIRRFTFYFDTARALTRTGQHEAAVRALHTAEVIAPQRLRAATQPREVVRVMLGEVGDRDLVLQLRGMAERMGLSLASM